MPGPGLSTHHVIHGGVKINPQIERLCRRVDILIATPGTLLDHVAHKTVNLSQVEILVLDEADRILDMSFLVDTRRVLALLPKNSERQNLRFSTTFSLDIKRLANQLLNRHELAEVARCSITAKRNKQVVHAVDKHCKRERLSHTIGSKIWRLVLVLTRSKHGANRSAQQLLPSDEVFFARSSIVAVLTEFAGLAAHVALLVICSRSPSPSSSKLAQLKDNRQSICRHPHI